MAATIIEFVSGNGGRRDEISGFGESEDFPLGKLGLLIWLARKGLHGELVI
jgi:hypothetical protein